MILAEKIIKLRKQMGWSQEDLAIHMDVSRQSVSKWESMASIPDLDKIIKLSQIFGVSTDYLLKDEIEDAGECVPAYDGSDAGSGKVKVSMEEATAYMTLIRSISGRFAGAVAACIFSPVILILLAVYSDQPYSNISENMAAGFGVACLLLIVACAVMVFIACGMKTKKYEFLDNELLDLEYGVAGIAQTKKDNFASTHKASVAAGVGLCIASVVPLFIAIAFTDENEMVIVSMVGLLLTLVACGVFCIVRASMIDESFQKLLEEDDYTPEKKLMRKKNDNLSTVYWCLVLAIYLGWSFITMDWQITWIVWPVAGVLFGAVCAAANMIRK